MSAVYEGFSNKSKMIIVIMSALGAMINLGLAWYIADKALNEIPISNEDIKEIKLLSSDLNDTEVYSNNLQLRVHALNAQVHLKGITNKQSIIIVSFGSGFAFIAIGFALFLIGADGALKVKQNDADSKLMISATTPGIVSFLFAAILIFYGVSRKHKLELGTTEFLNKIPVYIPGTDSVSKSEHEFNDSFPNP